MGKEEIRVGGREREKGRDEETFKKSMSCHIEHFALY